MLESRFNSSLGFKVRVIGKLRPLIKLKIFLETSVINHSHLSGIIFLAVYSRLLRKENSWEGNSRYLGGVWWVLGNFSSSRCCLGSSPRWELSDWHISLVVHALQGNFRSSLFFQSSPHVVDVQMCFPFQNFLFRSRIPLHLNTGCYCVSTSQYLKITLSKT